MPDARWVLMVAALAGKPPGILFASRQGRRHVCSDEWPPQARQSDHELQRAGEQQAAAPALQPFRPSSALQGRRRRDAGNDLPVLTGRRDWAQVLGDLGRAGLSMADVAAKCGKSKDAVHEWVADGEPREVDARVVLALYAQHCPKQYIEHQRPYEIWVKVPERLQSQ